MMHILELLIVLVGGVLGGICLLLFGCMMAILFAPILLLAWDHKRGKATPLDRDYTDDWEREFEDESWID
ncbi:hypothetical protein ES703_48218 [subsurface metagenome]